jgi:flagellar FliL protein
LTISPDGRRHKQRISGARRETGAASPPQSPATQGFRAVARGLQRTSRQAQACLAYVFATAPTPEVSMSATAENTVPVARKKGKGRLLAVLAVAVLAIGTGGFFLLHKKGGEEAAKSAHHDALYQPLEPGFVVNFQDDRALRFLQVGITVMSHDPEAIQAVKDTDPVIRNALVMLFSGQDATTLTDAKGKQKLQAEALVAVQKIVADKTGKPGIDAVYFTSFVMQ